MLGKKYSFSIFCLLIIFFVTHPSKGLALIIATSPIVLFQIFNEKSNKNFRSNTFSIIICSLIASVYSVYVLKDNVTKMSNDEWMRIVDTHSYHILLGNINEKFLIFFFSNISFEFWNLYKVEKIWLTLYRCQFINSVDFWKIN